VALLRHEAHAARVAGLPAARRPIATCCSASLVCSLQRRAIRLVWDTNRALLVAMGLLTLVAALRRRPCVDRGTDRRCRGLCAQCGRAQHRARDATGGATGCHSGGDGRAQRGLSLCQSLLRAQLGSAST